MRAQILRQAAMQAFPGGRSDAPQELPLLSRWCAADKRYVLAELDWNDPLDAAVGLQVVRFRSGVDAFDA